MRIWTSLAAAAAISLATAASAATKIEMYFPVPVEGKLAIEMKSLIDEFNKGHSDIDVTPVYTGSYDQTNIKTRAAIEAGHPPAAVIMSANFVLEYQINNEIEPLDKMIEAGGSTPETYMSRFWPALLENAEFDGHVWAVPFQNSTPLLYYNKKLFKEAGLDPAHPPATWAELVADAKKLTKTSGDETSRFGLMLPGNYDYLGWIMEALSMSNGGLYFNPAYGGEVYYNQPSMLGAVRFVDDLIHKFKVMPTGVTDSKAASTAFFAGDTAMTILSTGSLSFIRENMKDPYGVAFVPRHLRNAVAIGGASLIMPKGLDDAQKKASWTLINWLTSPEIAGRWSRFTGYFAPNRAAYDLPAMKAFLAKNPDAVVALKQLAFAHGWFATYSTVAVRKALEDQVQAVMSGNTDPATAVAAAQKKADEIMAPYVAQTALKLPQ